MRKGMKGSAEEKAEGDRRRHSKREEMLEEGRPKSPFKLGKKQRTKGPNTVPPPLKKSNAALKKRQRDDKLSGVA